MSKGSITTAIRNAIINFDGRVEQLEDIMSSVGCERHKAKELYYAFLYRADEDYLVYLLQRGESDE